MKISNNLSSVFILPLSFIIIHFFALDVFAEIFVHDMVAMKNEKVLLKAEIRGKFSGKGGELLEFFINEKSIGRTLSGGDGIAYKEFLPLKTGLHRVKVKHITNNSETTGFLLALSKRSKVVFVGFDEGLLEGKFLKTNPRLGSQNAIKEINKRYPVVILQSGLLSKRMIRQWLIKNDYIDLPVIAWGRGKVFDELVQKGIIIKAVVGSKAIIESAKKYKPLSFSFMGIESSEPVKDWDEIKRKILRRQV